MKIYCNNDPDWKIKLQNLKTEVDDVQVWQIALNDFFVEKNKLFDLLSVDEKKKADSFYFERDKRRYIICRGLLRILIGEYLDLDPGKVRFSYGRFGKPILAGVDSTRSVNFNISHSENLAMIALTRDRRVGIDIEYIREIPEMDEIVGRFFSDREKSAFCKEPESSKKEWFFRTWTRKEAFLKGIGEGFCRELGTFSILPPSQENTDCIRIKEKPCSKSFWNVYDLNTISGYYAAFSVSD